MNARVITSVEWEQRKPEGLPDSFPADTNDVGVVVVENSGEIVATLAVLRVTHFENAWVHPRFRGNAGVLRRLLREAWEIPAKRGERWVLWAAEHGNETTARMYSRRGKRIDSDFYMVGIGG